MDMTLRSPVQIFINGRFFCIAQEVEVKENSPEFRKSLIPDNLRLDPTQFTGMVINIKKKLPTEEEKREVAKEKNKNEYNEFFNRMVNAVGDPSVHLPIE
jgi:hypothetical protein